ncbi:N-acetylmuramoyl-L-alanine amidase [Oceanobacillus damuensis]|uniref:N-acetylmuramoyl-L-alanine amidase n=1 Tax=Oceanobacillus damuensis TaxID=937928 RepID=UPI000A00D06B|nr:N-acetylmuramoyl-L-alanine amidase [Oceanobacillus damuensis]
MRKKWVSALLIMLLASLYIISEEASAKGNLKGIPEQYAAEVNYLIDKGIVVGNEHGEFMPEKSLTREEAATMIGRAKRLDGKEPRDTVFTDVDSDSFASGYIQKGYEADIIDGYGDGTFRPLNKITRLEMAYLVTKAFNYIEVVDVYYKDMPKDKNHTEVIRKVTAAGIANGTGDQLFKPNNSITRVEFSLMLSRALNPDFTVEASEFKSETKYVTATALNVRQGPGTNYNSIGLLYMNDKVTTHNQIGNWVYIKSGNLSGYVSQTWLTDNPPSTRVIAIDAGHGGSDPGAIANGIIEKELNLDVAKRVQQYLENENVKVIMTRSTDTYISLSGRVDIAVAKGADSFVSIHGNAATPSASGTETFYSTAALDQRALDSKALARFIQERLLAALGTKDRGVKTANFHVIAENPLPSALLELGFLTNESDAEILKTHKQASAKAISLGILDYYKWKGK